MTREAAIEAIEALLDGMEYCHVCENAVLIQEHPTHCEDCPPFCDDHEEPNCVPLCDLHARARKALEVLR